MMQNVLIVDDDELMQEALSTHLEAAGFSVCSVGNGTAALNAIDESMPDALVVDVRMHGIDGFTVLTRVRTLDDGLPVILISGARCDTAMNRATRLGATAFLAKPFDPRELTTHLERALRSREQGAHEVDASGQYAELVGASAVMRDLFEKLRQLERVDAPTVLVTGESGTGKELVARAIHSRGPRRAAPYVEVDCVAIPDTLIESELFGHEKGAFTDARQMKRGLFEVARGGVLFLDEIGEMAPMMQAKLLRALESRRFRRVGGLTDVVLDATVVAATNRDLAAEVKAGRFRHDLFFRLNVVPLHAPPLRARADDIPSLALHMTNALAASLHRAVPQISAAAMEWLRGYSWPGNVRELRNVIERALIFKCGDAPIDVCDLPRELRSSADDLAPQGLGFHLPVEGVRLVDVEKTLVEQALKRCGGNRTQAAKLLGITRFALRYRIDKFLLEPAQAVAFDDVDDVDGGVQGVVTRGVQ